MGKNPYDRYHADDENLKKGVYFEDEDIRVRVTYAGTENKRYEKMLKLRLKPYETVLQKDAMSDELFNKIIAEVYAATVVLEFEVKNDKGEFVSGVYDKEGNILEATEANIAMAFNMAQRLFSDVIKIATNFNLFKKGVRDEDIKN